MNKWKKRIVIAVVALLVAAAVIIPTTLLIQEKRVDTREVVIQSFILNYGIEGILRVVQRVEDIYIVQWEDAEVTYTSLYIDGVWVELGSSPKSSEE